MKRISRYTQHPFAITVYSEVTSTNTLLREAAENGAPEWTVIVAESQTAGRGRRGHSFWSPEGTGLYLSVLLRPVLPTAEVIPLLTPAAAVAAARAIEAISDQRADIKWVNDIYCDNKKVCGILTEGRPNAQTDGLTYAVVGVGINVSPPSDGFPEEIRDRAGAVLDAPADTARERLAAAFLEEFRELYMQLPAVTFYDEYRERCLRLGRSVTIPIGEERVAATALDVTERFELRVQTADGTVRDLNAGDVSICFA